MPRAGRSAPASKGLITVVEAGEYQSDRPTKTLWIESTREKTGQATDLELLQKTFDRMK